MESATTSGILDTSSSTTSPGIQSNHQPSLGSERKPTSWSAISTERKEGCLGVFLVFFSLILIALLASAWIFFTITGEEKM